MYLLVSDYDGTLNKHKRSSIRELKLNIEAINRFRQEGNVFVISTARPYDSFRKEEINLREFGIYLDYDYVSYADGTLLLNTYHKTIYIEPIDNKIKEYITTLEEKIPSIRYKIREYDGKCIACSIYVPLGINIDKYLEELCSIFGLTYRVSINNEQGIATYYLENNKVNKTTPIEFLQNKLSVPKRRIYTIGDDMNDYEMIKNYNGYAMKGSPKELKEISQGIYPTVKKLAKKLTNN